MKKLILFVMAIMVVLPTFSACSSVPDNVGRNSVTDTPSPAGNITSQKNDSSTLNPLYENPEPSPTDEGVSNSIADTVNVSDNITSALPNGVVFETSDGSQTPSADIATQLGYAGDYQDFKELCELLELDKPSIERSLIDFRSYIIEQPECFVYGLNTSDDIETILQILKEPYYPIMEGAEPTYIELYYDYGGTHWQVSLRYEVAGIVFTSTTAHRNSTKTKDVINNVEASGQWQPDLLIDEGDFRIYYYNPNNPDDPDLVSYDKGIPRKAIHFAVDISGTCVVVTVFYAADTQSAVDGLLAFSYDSLLF